MKKIIALTFGLLFILFQIPAHAALDLKLTQGVSGAQPIAIVPFSGESNLPEDKMISHIIQADLKNSGQFKVMDSSSMSQQPHQPDEVNTAYWRGAGNNDIVIGSIKQVGDQYQVNYALVDVFKEKQGSDATITQQSFTVPANKLRSLAHHISDSVYQQLTGVRGVFSTKIAYVVVQRNPGERVKYVLAIADADGFNPKPLLISKRPIMSPSWSHDGKQLAYVSFENVSPRIYIQNITTGSRRVVTSFPGINGAPAWSPDDSQLALVLSKGGNPKIYILNLASGELNQVTHDNAMDTEPAWSPNGTSLLFTSDRGGGPQIYQLDIATGKTQRLTFTGGYNARGSFSTDGKTIVMIHGGEGMYNIATQDLSDSSLSMLTQAGSAASPSFAPNGRMVLFESGSGARGVLGMASVDGRIRLKLPSQEGSVQDPAWSPFLS